MKHLKNIALIFLITLLTFCTYQNSEKRSNRDYTSAELIGKWNQVSIEKSLKDTYPIIKYIQLVNDSIAEVQIIDLTGERKISGIWNNSFEKEIGKTGIIIKSDIRIKYFLDKQNSQTLLLRISEENEKLIMIAQDYKFQKE